MTSADLAMPLWTRVPSEPDVADMISPAPRVRASKTQKPVAFINQSVPRQPNSPRCPFFLHFEEPEDVNKNTAWFSSPGVWSTYVIVIMLTWLFIQACLGCGVATALVAVHALHFVVTFYLFHWVKGSPFSEDQGMYDALTWWEQMDGGRQHTVNRKFMTLVPVALYLMACSSTKQMQHSNALLLVNTAMVFILVIAKLPMLHRIRIFGINA